MSRSWLTEACRWTALHTAAEARSVRRTVRYYSLDAILAVGDRVRSPRGTLFRVWATERTAGPPRAPAHLGIVLFVMALLCGCGCDRVTSDVCGATPAEGLSVTVDRLPEAATVGDLPGPPHRFVAELSPDRVLHVNGKPMSLPAFSRLLHAARGTLPVGSPEELKDDPISVVVRADKDLAWGFVFCVLFISTVDSVHHAYFTVRSTSDGEEGGLAAYPPIDQCCVPAGLEPIFVEAKLTTEPAGTDDWGRQYARLSAMSPSERDAVVLKVRAPAEAPVSEVIRVLDLACLAGIRTVTFQIREHPAETLRFLDSEEGVLLRKGTTSGFALRLEGPSLPPAPTSPPVLPNPPRVVGRFAGVTDPMTSNFEEEPAEGRPEEDL